MSAHQVKIVARLRPRLAGEQDDESVKVHHASDGSNGGNAGSFITVANPRDLSQVFKFP
jgi:kinesin family protein 22